MVKMLVELVTRVCEITFQAVDVYARYEDQLARHAKASIVLIPPSPLPGPLPEPEVELL